MKADWDEANSRVLNSNGERADRKAASLYGFSMPTRDGVPGRVSVDVRYRPGPVPGHVDEGLPIQAPHAVGAAKPEDSILVLEHILHVGVGW